MRVFGLIDLLLLTGLFAAIFALQHTFDPGVLLLMGFLPGAIFALRVAAGSDHPDLFARLGTRVKQAAIGGSLSAIFCAMVYFCAVEGDSIRHRPVALVTMIGTVFGILGAMGGVPCGAFYSLAEEVVASASALDKREPEQEDLMLGGIPAEPIGDEDARLPADVSVANPTADDTRGE